jgi:pyruvate dehydrogenase E2 component (dihydrolipoamide acetyltransferase)
MNGSWVNDELKTGNQININVAIQAPTGLLVPVIHQADRLDLDQIAAERRRLIASALEGSLDAQDVSNGTFTITNLGAFGVDAFTPIITVPQIAVLGVGRLTDMVVPKGSGVAVVPTMQLSLAFDHRAVDGAPAAEFLADVAEGLQAMQARSDATDHSH